MDNHIFHKSILALREYLWNNKEKVVKDLEEMREKSNQDKMKQTAVEWFWLNLTDDLIGDLAPEKILKIHELIEQAKAMEKEQIKNAFVECWKSNVPDGIECKLDAEQYYNETYKSE